VRRFRIRREHPSPPAEGRLYRVADIDPLEDPLPEADRLAIGPLRESITGMVEELVGRVAPERAGSLAESFERADDVTFVNTLSQSIDFSPVEKQGLLESATVRERFERLRDLLRFRLIDSRGGLPGSRETLH
jgi:hypothetical protein